VVAGGRRRALAAALVAAVAGVWLAWVTDTQLVWGVTNGPELGLWTVALAGVLAARNLGGRPARQ
jgi:fermentation-respiration switch protein FrsA (DUF1100 family)